MADGNPVVLIHLSDIHFRKGQADTPYDQDGDIRNELLRDAQILRADLEGITGVVITGDIAFAGKQDEYDIAKVWLNELTETCQCPSEHVWMVPGNHDVDRDVVDASMLIKYTHDAIRQAKEGEIDKALEGVLVGHPSDAQTIFQPLEAYRNFADKYSCPSSPEEAHWNDDLFLNDGSTLRLHGLNSAIISNGDDDDKDNRLIVNQGQLTQLRTEDGVEHVVLCHHPPDWLRAKDAIESKLKQRVRVQLFGHKHLVCLDEFDRKSIRIVAGATHPDRAEDGWQPRYNAVSFYVETSDDGSRKLLVRVYPRVLGGDHQFGPDYNLCNNAGLSYREYEYQLGAWAAPRLEAVEDISQKGAAEEVKNLQETNSVNPEKKLVNKFLSLPFPAQMEVANELELLHDGDDDLSKLERFKLLFERARSEEKLEALWDRVIGAGVPDAGQINPFVGR